MRKTITQEETPYVQRKSPVRLSVATMAQLVRASTIALLNTRSRQSAAGVSARQAAVPFGVGISTAIRWIARAREGEPTSRPQGWRRPSILDAQEAFVVEMIDERKDITLDEMVEWLSVERQVGISRSALGAWLRGRGWTFKKVRTYTGAGSAGCPEASASLV